MLVGSTQNEFYFLLKTVSGWSVYCEGLQLTSLPSFVEEERHHQGMGEPNLDSIPTGKIGL